MRQQRQLEIERRLRDIVGERVFVDVAQRCLTVMMVHLVNICLIL